MLKRISPWQALFRYFPSSMNDAEHAVVRANTINGRKLTASDAPQVRAEIARRIGTLEHKNREHSQAVATRFRRGQAVQSSESTEDPLASLAADLEARTFAGPEPEAGTGASTDFNADSFFGNENELADDPAPTLLHGMPLLTSVNAHQINLIDLGNSQVQIEVFPRIFRCPGCGHLHMADPLKGLPTCPCCSTCRECFKTFRATVGQQCPSCSSSDIRQTVLRQLSVIEVCSRCALVRELFPYGLRLRPEDFVGRQISCPKCKIGHIHLRRKLSLADARFVCSRGCTFAPWEAELGQHCPECSVRRNKDDGFAGNEAYMKPSPAVASSNLQPLVESFLFLGTEEANLTKLKEGYFKQRSTGLRSWSLEQLDDPAFPQKQDAVRKICGIRDAFTLADIRTTTVNYGYWSQAQEHKQPIGDNERLHRFYPAGSNYDVYCNQTEGRGLVIALDKVRLLNSINETTGANFATYAELVAAGIVQLRGDQPAGQIVFQDLIDPTKAASMHDLALIRLLHSVEHAIITEAEEQVGLQIFGAKILLKDATVVLYEQEDVGDGGIEQLVTGNGFLKLMRSVRNSLATCGQDCETACPACNFVEDVKCRPFIPHEFDGAGVRWIPPNALLDRRMAHHYLETCDDEA